MSVSKFWINYPPLPWWCWLFTMLVVCSGLFALKGFDSFAELNRYSTKRWCFFSTLLALWIGHILMRSVVFDLLTVKPLCKSSFMLVYFLKDPLHYSKSKYLIIGCWKPCKKTCLYFWNPLGTSATASLHPKWKVGSDFIPWSCLAGVWLCEKTKIMKAECLREAFSYSFKVMLLSQRKWRSSQCIGLFDCIVSKSETEPFLESSIPGLGIHVLLHFSDTKLLRACLWNWLFLQCYIIHQYTSASFT